MLADGIRDTPATLGALINAAASGGRLKLAEKLINTMQAEHSITPDKGHYAPVLTAYYRAGKPERCLKALQVCQQCLSNLVVDFLLCIACEKQHQQANLERADVVVSCEHVHSQSSAHTSSCVQCWRMEKRFNDTCRAAVCCHTQDMQERNIAADTVMYNQVLGACAKANRVSTA